LFLLPVLSDTIIIIIIIIISSSSSSSSSSISIRISIQPLGQFGKEPEPSQATGMAVVRCILSKFLGVVCHCFPPIRLPPQYYCFCCLSSQTYHPQHTGIVCIKLTLCGILSCYETNLITNEQIH